MDSLEDTKQRHNGASDHERFQPSFHFIEAGATTAILVGQVIRFASSSADPKLDFWVKVNFHRGHDDSRVAASKFSEIWYIYDSAGNLVGSPAPDFPRDTLLTMLSSQHEPLTSVLVAHAFEDYFQEVFTHVKKLLAADKASEVRLYLPSAMKELLSA